MKDIAQTEDTVRAGSSSIGASFDRDSTVPMPITEADGPKTRLPNLELIDL